MTASCVAASLAESTSRSAWRSSRSIATPFRWTPVTWSLASPGYAHSDPSCGTSTTCAWSSLYTAAEYNGAAKGRHAQQQYQQHRPPTPRACRSSRPRGPSRPSSSACWTHTLTCSQSRTGCHQPATVTIGSTSSRPRSPWRCARTATRSSKKTSSNASATQCCSRARSVPAPPRSQHQFCWSRNKMARGASAWTTARSTQPP